MPAACPDDSGDYVVTDSDELLAIELSDPGHHFRTGFRKSSVDDVVTWAEQFTDLRHRRLFRREVRMHTGIKTPAWWIEAGQKAAQVARAVERRMKRGTWLLIKSGEWDLVRRRSIRYVQDRRLRTSERLRRPNPSSASKLAFLGATRAKDAQ